MMKKSLSTLVLLGISALIILFILSSFYRVLNRAPKYNQEPAIETTVEQANAPSAAADDTSPAEADEAAAENPMDSLVTAPASAEQAEEAAEQETSDDEAELMGTPGQLIHDNPHLQNAVPPVPQAPPSPQGSPVVTAPNEQSYSDTGDSGQQGSFPQPIIVEPTFPDRDSGGSTSFPAPVSPNNKAAISDLTRPAPAPSVAPTGNRSFPAPIINNNTSGSSNIRSSSSFPAPQ